MIKYEFKGNRDLLKQLKYIEKHFPREVREAVYNTAFVSIEGYIKRNDIPVDTGRLRASFTTKSVKKETHSYTDRDGTVYDGTLSERIDLDTVIVGSNVDYAERINKFGGGGENSRRTVNGNKRSKGYGQGFFDKAVKNGQIMLMRRLQKLVDGIGGMV
jgi:phage gpG-like protein